MSDISGLSSRTPLAFFDPDSCAWKTSRLTFLSDSMSSSLTLPASGMTHGGVLYALPMSGPVTSEPASSSSPTPTVGDSKSARNPTAGRTDPDSQHHSGTTLTDAVTLLPAAADGVRGPDYARMERDDSGGDDLVTTMARMLPTPTSRDHKGRNQRDDETCLPGAVGNLLPTPTAWEQGSDSRWDDRVAEMKAKGYNGNGAGMPLDVAVRKMLPTPEASDSTGGRRSKELGGTRASGAKRAITLATALDHRSTGESTEPPSSDTSGCSVEQLRIL